MSKRNLKLLIMLIVIIIGVVLSYLFLGNKPTDKTNDGADGGSNFFADLLNFGKNDKPGDTNTNPPTDISDYTPPEEVVMQKMKLVKISSMPIAGYSVFNKERFEYVPDIIPPTTTPENEVTPFEEITKKIKPTAPNTEFIPVLRYVEKTTGNIYQTFIDTINERKFSDTLVPGVHEAYFGDNGGAVVMRYLKSDNSTVASWRGDVPKDVLGSDSTGYKKITGSFLPDNVTDMSVSPNGDKIFYLYNSNNTAIGTTSYTDGKNKSQVFTGAYTEWLSQWPNIDLITLTTKPSYDVLGYMYGIDPNKKDFKKIMGGIKGLTTLTSPDGRYVLHSDNSVAMRLYNTTNGENTSLSIKTLPEKCVWVAGSVDVYCSVPKFINNSNLYPDLWYQGEVSFSDDIWKINVEDGVARLILDPLAENGTTNQNTEIIDGVKLSLSEDGKYLFFVNKVDSFLWGLEL